MNEANYGKCRDLSVIWEFSKNSGLWDTPNHTPRAGLDTSSPQPQAVQWMEQCNGQGRVIMGSGIAVK